MACEADRTDSNADASVGLTWLLPPLRNAIHTNSWKLYIYIYICVFWVVDQSEFGVLSYSVSIAFADALHYSLSHYRSNRNKFKCFMFIYIGQTRRKIFLENTELKSVCSCTGS